MTRAGKESQRNQLNNYAEATSDSVGPGSSSSQPPLGKRKGTFGDGASSSEQKVGKRRQSNNASTATLATSSKNGKKGKAKAESQIHETANTSIDTMDMDNCGGTNELVKVEYCEQDDETAGHDMLKERLGADIKDTHMNDKLTVKDDGGGGGNQHEVKTGWTDSSGVNDDNNKNNNNNHDDDDDIDDPEDLDDHYGMHLDTGVGGSGDHSIGLAEGFDIDDDYDDEYGRYGLDGEFGALDSLGRMRNGMSGQHFMTILENLRNNGDQSQQLKTLQNLAETISISSEEHLAGYFPCDPFAQELVKIMKGSSGPVEDANEDDVRDFTLNDQNAGGNPELMVLACRCISNLLDVLPSAAPRMVNYGVIGVLCDKLRSIQYIDLAEQALEALKEISGQAPLAVIQNGGLGATFMHFDFFSIHSQRTALQMASHCMQFIKTDAYQQLVEALPTLTNTLASSDHTIVELACLCWARLSENYRSTPTEFDKVLSMDILNIMVGLLPVPGNASGIHSSAFNDILRVFRSVAKASPTLGCQLLHLDVIGSFYQVLSGTTTIPSSPASLISLDNTWHDSLHTILNTIIDLLPPLPKDQEFNWNRFKKMEPIALRTRSRTTHTLDTAPPSTSVTTSSSSSTATKTPLVPDPRTKLLESNPQLSQRIGTIIFPLLLEIFSSTVNLTIRQLVTHTMVKLVFYMDGTTLKFVLQDIPLSAFLAGLLAHQEHSAFVIDALFQAEFLLKKLPGVYATLFQREGVYYETKALASKNMVEDDGTPVVKTNSTAEAEGIPVQYNLSAMVHTNKKSERSDIMQRPSTYSLDDLSSTANLTITTNDVMAEFSPHYTMRSDIDQNRDYLLERRILMHKTQQNQQRSNDGSKSGIGHGLLRRFIIQLAQNHIKDYAIAAPATRDNNMDSLQVLKQFVDGLVGTPDDGAARKVLENIVSYINSTVVGISGFELLESGILEALLDYLTLQQQHDNGYAASLVQRRQAFYEVLFETLQLDQDTGLLVSPALRTLVQSLGTLFTRLERFKVELPLDSTLCSLSSLSGITRSLTQLVTKQIRLRLYGQGSHVPAEIQHLTVATQAMATFHVLEKYLLARIIGTGVNQNRLKANNTQNDGNTEIIDLDKTGLEAKSDSKNTSLQISLPNHPVATTLSSTSGPVSPVSSSTTPPTLTVSTATGKSQNTYNGNWKVQFYMDNTLISHDTSFFGAVHQSLTKKSKENGSRAGNYNTWTTAHSVVFKCIFIDGKTGNSKKKKTTADRQLDEIQPSPPLPELLTDDKNSTCVKILQLLKELATISQLPSATSSQSSKLERTVTALVPMTDFVNRKLATKMQRQLEEPLIVASACLPDWAYYCMDNYPFLFPFDVRYMYFQSTSYNVSRLVANWQRIYRRNNDTQDGQRHHQIGTGRHEAGIGGDEFSQSQSTAVRIERKKVQVRRDQILEYAIKVMDLSGNSQSVLEIGYMDEEGTGLGPTMEFYALASKEFCKKSTHMWRQEDDDDPSIGESDGLDKLYVASHQGLFPTPLSKHMDQYSRKRIVRLFKSLGQFVAKSMLDFRIIDIPFNTAFFKQLFNKNDNPLDLITDIDPVLGKSVSHLQAYVDKKRLIENDKTLAPKKRNELVENIEIDGAKIEDLCLDFTLPGRADIDLKHDGSKISVTIESVEEYIQLLGDMIAGSGVNEQLSAFRDGFNGLFSIEGLKVLTCQELVSLFGSSSEDWSYSTLADAIKADHGFTMDSVTIKNLLEILSEMNIQEQRGFLQFTTGSPRLPIGGWKSMRPMFTVVKKNCDAPLGPDDYLPSVMTCANYLKMPDYTSKVVMHKQLSKSIHEGRNSFLLS